MKYFLNERTMRVTIRDKSSTWKGVISGVPQGSELAPISCTVNECGMLQQDLDKLWEWSKKMGDGH